MKWDGHTHSEFCPHGSGEDCEQFIRRAIECGLTDYSITEHAPLPPDFLKKCAGAQAAIDTAGMTPSDVEPYLKKMHRLKEKYKSDLRIYVGFEVDYLHDFTDWTHAFLDEYGACLDDGILSLHFLPGVSGYRAIDYSAEDYRDGLVSYYGNFQKAQCAYFAMLRQSVAADLGINKPKRIGHMTLCRKFKEAFADEDNGFSPETETLIDQFLDDVARGGYALDYNTAGLYKPLCREPYPVDPIMRRVIEKNISFVFGSDAHQVEDIGGGYDYYRRWAEPDRREQWR